MSFLERRNARKVKIRVRSFRTGANKKSPNRGAGDGVSGKLLTRAKVELAFFGFFGKYLQWRRIIPFFRFGFGNLDSGNSILWEIAL